MPLSTRRTSRDPLVRALVESHKFNLLSAPRENADVYDFYIGRGRNILPPSRLHTILPSEVRLPAPTRGESFKAPEKTFSASLKVDIVTTLTSKLFKAHGATLFDGKLTGALKSAGASSGQIRFHDVVRDYVGPLEVHKRISRKDIGSDNAAMLRTRDLYLVIGVLRAKGIEIVASTEHQKMVRANIEVEDISQGGSVAMDRKESGGLVFRGPKYIAFGVELVELHLGVTDNTLRVGDLPPAIDIKQLPEVPSTFIGSPDGSIFVDLP